MNELKQLIEWLKANNGPAELIAFLENKLKPVTLETVKEFLEKDIQGQILLRSLTDSAITKGNKTFEENFKTNELPKLLDEEIKRRFPEKTAEQKELAELKAKIEKTESEAKKEKLLNRALTICTEKGIPAKLANLLVGADEELTTANITLVETVFTEHVTTEVEKRLKLGGREGKPGSEGKPGEYTGPNPWKKETFNLTLQGKLLTENPELAKSLQAQAK